MSFAEQLNRLQAFLDADELHDEALDYVAAHGYLTALAICSEPVPDREWIDALFAEIDPGERESLARLLHKIWLRTDAGRRAERLSPSNVEDPD